MAYGFRDCCNSSSFFYLTGIPATVQENEIFLIETLQGETFCATYTKIPSLNYSVPTYTLVTMVEKQSCNICDNENPCPSEQQIFLSQFGSGTIATSTDCFLKTIFPLVTICACQPTTSNDTATGKLGISVFGGIPPYIFYQQGEEFNEFAIPYTDTPGTLTNQRILQSNLLPGDYAVTVTDSQGNFYENITCTIENQPPPPTLSCGAQVAPSHSNAWAINGSSTINISGGVPPYTIVRNNVQVQSNYNQSTYTSNNLLSGQYTYQVTSSSSTSELGNTFPGLTATISCTVPQSQNSVIYPINLCFNFTYCGQKFYLTFNQNGSVNDRPKYVFNSTYSDNVFVISNSNLSIEWVNGKWQGQGSISITNINFSNTPNPANCSTNGTIILSTQTNNVTLDKKPTDQTWILTGTLGNGISVGIQEGICKPTLRMSSQTNQVDLTYCSSNTAENSQITLMFVAEGVGTFTYFYRKQGASSYISSSTDTVIINTNSSTFGGFGTYEAYVQDSGNNNLLSELFTFSISDFCYNSTTSQNDTAQICLNPGASNPDYDYVFNKPTGFPSGTWSLYIKTPGSPNFALTGTSINTDSRIVTLSSIGAYQFYATADNSEYVTGFYNLTITEVCNDVTPDIRILSQQSNCTDQPDTISISIDNYSNFEPYQWPVVLYTSNNGSGYQILLENINETDTITNVSLPIGGNNYKIIDSVGNESNVLHVDNYFDNITIDLILEDDLYELSYPDSTDYSNCSNTYTANYMVGPDCGIERSNSQTSPLARLLNPNFFHSWIKNYEIKINVSNLNEGEQVKGIWELKLSIFNYFSIYNPKYLYRVDTQVSEGYMDFLQKPTSNDFFKEYAALGWYNNSPATILNFEDNDDKDCGGAIGAPVGQFSQSYTGEYSKFQFPGSLAAPYMWCIDGWPTNCCRVDNATQQCAGNLSECSEISWYTNDPNCNFKSMKYRFSNVAYSHFPVGPNPQAFPNVTVSNYPNLNTSAVYTATEWDNFPSFITCEDAQGRQGQEFYISQLDIGDGTRPPVTTYRWQETARKNYQGYTNVQRIFTWGTTNAPKILQGDATGSLSMGRLRFTYKGLYFNHPQNSSSGFAGKNFRIDFSFTPTQLPPCPQSPESNRTIDFMGQTTNQINQKLTYTWNISQRSEDYPPGADGTIGIFDPNGGTPLDPCDTIPCIDDPIL